MLYLDVEQEARIVPSLPYLSGPTPNQSTLAPTHPLHTTHSVEVIGKSCSVSENEKRQLIPFDGLWEAIKYALLCCICYSIFQ